MAYKLRITCLAILLLSWSAKVYSHESIQFGSDVFISSISAVESPIGGSTVLAMNIDNRSNEHLHLLRISSEASDEVKLVGRIGHMSGIELDSTTIPTDELVNFGSSHLRIELNELKRSLEPGDFFEVRLEFVRGTAILPVHVHAAATRHVQESDDSAKSQ